LRPKSSPNDGTSVVWESTRASRVVVGAPADHIFSSPLLPMERAEAVGEGADCHTRKRVCSPAKRYVALGEDLGARGAGARAMRLCVADAFSPCRSKTGSITGKLRFLCNILRNFLMRGACQ
jgi:hypothetical protein